MHEWPWNEALEFLSERNPARPKHFRVIKFLPSLLITRQLHLEFSASKLRRERSNWGLNPNRLPGKPRDFVQNGEISDTKNRSHVRLLGIATNSRTLGRTESFCGRREACARTDEFSADNALARCDGGGALELAIPTACNRLRSYEHETCLGCGDFRIVAIHRLRTAAWNQRCRPHVRFRLGAAHSGTRRSRDRARGAGAHAEGCRCATGSGSACGQSTAQAATVPQPAATPAAPATQAEALAPRRGRILGARAPRRPRRSIPTSA